MNPLLQPFITTALPIVIAIVLASWTNNKAFDGVHKRMDDMNKRLDDIVTRLGRIEGKLDNHEGRIVRLEERTSLVR